MSFPFEEMADLSTALADVTEQLFAIDPKPWQSFPDERRESPLCGAIEYRGRRLRGNMAHITATDFDEPTFVFPSMPAKPVEWVEHWETAPFAMVDSGFRPSILTRLISEANGVWEYTRFLAERNSVIRTERPDYLPKLHVPSAAEYPKTETEDEGAPEEVLAPVSIDAVTATVEFGDTDFERALRNIANEDYEPAIRFFTAVVAKRPNYHTGWLRLGHSQREFAMRIRFDDPSRATQLFSDSIDTLTRAAEHSHANSRAQAFYERSKAYFHRGRLSKNSSSEDDLRSAKEDADAAYAQDRESRYETWIEYLSRHLDHSGPSD